MESLPQVAAALDHVLSEVADEAAAAVGFIRRRRVLTGALFVQGLVLGWLARPEASLHQLTRRLAVRGAVISPQGLAQRFGPEAAALLERVLAAAILTAVEPAVPLLARCNGIGSLDCTTIRLPDALAAVWRGGGGRTGRGTQAALKRQVRRDLASGRLEGPALLDGRTQDKAGPLHGAPAPAGGLQGTDLGFWSLARLRTLGERGAFWLSRRYPATVVCAPDGARRDLPRWLARQRTPTVEAAVLLGARARLRLAEAFVLGRARWQIALRFKLWKQDGRLATSRSADPWRVLCEVSATLLALLIQPWLLLIGCWDHPARSLTRAAQTVRDHAVCLLRALDHPPRPREELAALIHCVRTGCRIAKRKTHPSAYQLWLDPTLGGLT